MKQDEYGRLPEEHPEPADEFAPLPPEFAGSTPVFPEASRKMRIFQIAAAALLLCILLLWEPVTQSRPVPELSGNPAGTSPSETGITEPLEASAPSDDPTQLTEQKAFVPPQCRAVFPAFSDTLKARLIFTEPESILSVTAELWDSLGQTMEQSWEVPREDILAGAYLLPDMMGTFDIFMAHHTFEELSEFFPEPELRVTMVYTDGTEEHTVELQQPASPELGWYVRAKDGMIAFHTYEWETQIPVRIAGEVSQDLLSTLADGEILITIVINGTLVPESACRVTHETEIFQNSAGEDVPYYYAGVTVPYGDGSGTAVVTVYQKLIGCDAVWIELAEAIYPESNP